MNHHHPYDRHHYHHCYVIIFFIIPECKKTKKFDFAHLAEAVTRDIEDTDRNEPRDAYVISHALTFIQQRMR